MTIFLLVYASVTLAVWIVITAVCIYGWQRTRRLMDVGRPRAGEPPLPRVSIIVTAQNEERQAERALRSLIDLNYPNYEVVYVNDRSDDRTGEIADRLSAEDGRIKPLHVSTLPDGWFGKNYAAYRGAQVANGEVLLFTDGDVVFAPDALAYGVRHLRRAKLDHLCVAPLLPVSGALLQACMIVFAFTTIVVARLWQVQDPHSSAYFGIGPYNMFRTGAYHAIGGHRRIRLRPDEDIKLGKLVKQCGRRSDCVIGISLLSFEWYPSLRHFIRGGDKNISAALEYRVWPAVGITVALLGLLVAPFPLVPVVGGWPAILFAACAGVCWTVAVAGARTGRYPWWTGLLFPVGILVITYMMWRSTIITTTRGVSWGGSPIPLSELRSNRV